MSNSHLEHKMHEQPLDTSTNVALLNTGEGYALGLGKTVPTDSAAGGYCPGAIFIHTDGSAGAQLYVNEGTKTSNDFNALQSVIFDDVSSDATTSAAGVLTINTSIKTQKAQAVVAALTADSDLTATILWSAPASGCTLTKVSYLMQTNAIGTIDDSNTSVFTVTDGGSNTIVAKTYNTATQPTAPGLNDLGSLSATHKVLTAGETVSLAITNGTSAATPAGFLVLEYIPTNA